jgi:GDP-L-fucose synthase
MHPSSRIFVAGGTGMVGSAIIRKLLSSGYSNIVSNYHSRIPSSADFGSAAALTLRSRPSTSASISACSPIHWLQLDLTRQSDTETFFDTERPDYVFLAAAKVGGILANDTYKADFIYDNIAIAGNVINSAHIYGVKKLLNLGSSCIYPRLASQPMKEEELLSGALEPTNEPYAIAKIAAIKLCRYFNEQYGTNYLSAMPTNLYGPNDNFNLETSHVLPALMRKFHLALLTRNKEHERLRKDVEQHPLGFGLDGRIGSGDTESLLAVLERLGITGEYVTIWGSGEPYREFLHVDDLADAALFLMERYDYSQIGEFVNIGLGEDMRLRDLALMVKEVVGFPGEIRNDLSKQDGMPKKLLDISAVKRLGWQPRIGLREGIEKTYSWYIDRQRREAS